MRTRRALVVLAMSLSVPVATFAQNTGIRVGVSGGPDQFVFGGHLESGPLVDRLVFRPSGEIGIGDGLVLIGLNFEFAYKIALDDSSWTPYLGGGPALNIRNFDNDRRRGGDTEAGGGFNIMIGVEHDGGLFTEFKVGAIDSPDLKFLVGYSF